VRPTRTPEVREECLASLRACRAKWWGVYVGLVGWLYPPVVEGRYLRPLDSKVREMCRPGFWGHGINKGGQHGGSS
jgi:hypothetical protein